jgi:hypothetical protein
MRSLTAVFATFFITLSVLYLSCVHYSGITQVGLMRNRISGELKRDIPGWNISPPWVSVAKVDTTPIRVCVTTAGRGFNCKLVEFIPSEFKAFVKTEGFYYYWWANRISFNFGYDEEYRGMKDLLRGYAYGVKQYPFVRVLRDYEQGL